MKLTNQKKEKWITALLTTIVQYKVIVHKLKKAKTKDEQITIVRNWVDGKCRLCLECAEQCHYCIHVSDFSQGKICTMQKSFDILRPKVTYSSPLWKPPKIKDINYRIHYLWLIVDKLKKSML